MTAPAALTRDRVMQLIKKMKASRIVVIGDIMIDRYLIGDTERLSPEAPVPVVTVRERQAKLGGAANVAANVASIGASVSPGRRGGRRCRRRGHPPGAGRRHGWTTSTS